MRKHIIGRAVLGVVVAANIAMWVTACAVPAEKESTGTAPGSSEQQEAPENDTFTPYMGYQRDGWIELDDGRKVYCLRLDESISCDWDGAE